MAQLSPMSPLTHINLLINLSTRCRSMLIGWINNTFFNKDAHPFYLQEVGSPSLEVGMKSNYRL